MTKFLGFYQVFGQKKPNSAIGSVSTDFTPIRP